MADLCRRTVPGGTGLQASCDDVAKLALLYLNEGEWAGHRVLPRDWVHMAAQPHSVNAGNGTPDWCAGYGYQFWMNRRGGFRGDGAFGQLCVVLPENGIAAAVTAECTNMSAELDALWLLLENLHKQDGACADGGLPEACIPPRQAGRQRMGVGAGWIPAKPGGFHRPACARGRGSRLCMAVRRQQMCGGVRAVRYVAGEYALGEKFPSRHLPPDAEGGTRAAAFRRGGAYARGPAGAGVPQPEYAPCL